MIKMTKRFKQYLLTGAAALVLSAALPSQSLASGFIGSGTRSDVTSSSGAQTTESYSSSPSQDGPTFGSGENAAADNIGAFGSGLFYALSNLGMFGSGS